MMGITDKIVPLSVQMNELNVTSHLFAIQRLKSNVERPHKTMISMNWLLIVHQTMFALTKVANAHPTPSVL